MPGYENTRTQLTAQMRINLALEELKKRGVSNDYCPRCNTFDWNVDISDVPASSAMSRPGLAGIGRVYTKEPTGFLSMLSVVCKNCGYTMFHNMGVLNV